MFIHQLCSLLHDEKDSSHEVLPLECGIQHHLLGFQLIQV